MGQGEPAMIPVRSEVRSNSREARVFQFGDEHGGHAVDGRAALLGDGLERGQRVEVFRRNHHRRTVRHAHHDAQHHAEAVEERHRDAQLILAGKAHALADQQAVVHKIVMAQQRALGRAGGARGVLNVDGVVKFQGRGAGRQGVGGNALAHLEQVVPGHHAGGRGRVSDKNQIAQVRQLGRLERPRRAACGLRADLEKDGRVVTLAEPPRQQESRTFRLLKGVFNLHGAVSGVKVHQDGADFGYGELRDHPLGVVGGPDSHPLALLDAQTQKSPRSALDLAQEFMIRVTLVLVTCDQGGRSGGSGRRCGPIIRPW